MLGRVLGRDSRPTYSGSSEPGGSLSEVSQNWRYGSSRSILPRPDRCFNRCLARIEVKWHELHAACLLLEGPSSTAVTMLNESNASSAVMYTAVQLEHSRSEHGTRSLPGIARLSGSWIGPKRLWTARAIRARSIKGQRFRQRGTGSRSS